MHGMIVDVFMLFVEHRDDGLVVVAEGEDLLGGDADDGCLRLVGSQVLGEALLLLGD